MKKLFLGVVLTTVLIGCESNDGNENSETQYPIISILKKVNTDNFQYQMYAGEGKDAVELIVTIIPKGNTQFNKKSVSATESIAVTKLNDKMLSAEKVTNYFTSPFRYEGYQDKEGSVGIVEKFGDIPKMAKIGDSGKFYDMKIYANNEKTIIDKKQVAVWSLNTANSSTAKLCVNTDVFDKDSTDVDSSISECYTVNKEGDILKYSLSFMTNPNDGLTGFEFTSR